MVLKKLNSGFISKKKIIIFNTLRIFEGEVYYAVLCLCHKSECTENDCGMWWHGHRERDSEHCHPPPPPLHAPRGTDYRHDPAWQSNNSIRLNALDCPTFVHDIFLAWELPVMLITLRYIGQWLWYLRVTVQSNRRRSPNVGSMLIHRFRRRPKNKPVLYHCIVFAGHMASPPCCDNNPLTLMLPGPNISVLKQISDQ